jgi:hypothetical protein
MISGSVEGMALEACNGGIQPAAGDDQQREAGADLFVVDAHVSSFVKWHSSLLTGVARRPMSEAMSPREDTIYESVLSIRRTCCIIYSLNGARLVAMGSQP